MKKTVISLLSAAFLLPTIGMASAQAASKVGKYFLGHLFGFSVSSRI